MRISDLLNWFKRVFRRYRPTPVTAAPVPAAREIPLNVSVPPARSRKRATQRGYRHVVNPSAAITRPDGFTNNQRVVYGRARRMGITVQAYRAYFPKGYNPQPIYLDEIPF